ncbi:MAG: esterase family protein, partial [Victivallaceae bacterium]
QHFQCCGTEEFLYQDNLKFRDHIEKLGAYSYQYRECPGAHTWEFWDEHIQRILKWLPLR